MTHTRLAALGLLSFALILGGVLGADGLSMRSASVWALITSALVIVFLAKLYGMWSMACIFAIVLSLFHVGLAVFPVLGITPLMAGAPTAWFYSTAAPVAMWIASMAILAFGVGVVLIGSTTQSLSEPQSRSPIETASALHAVVGRAGLVTLLAAVTAWVFFCLQSIGLNFPLVSYARYKSATADYPMDYVFFGISLGMVLLAAIDDRSRVRYGLVVFGGFALLGLPLGLRGEVLFPLAAYAVVSARHRTMPRVTAVILLVALVLSGVSGIKQLRQTGIEGAGNVTLSLTPLAGLGELGYTLRTVEVVTVWHGAGSEPAANGATYWAPVERLLGRAGIGPKPIPANADNRLLNVQMRAREGNIGGSIVAEAAHNFGLSGVVLVLAIWGMFTGLLQNRKPSIRSDLLLGLVLTVLLQQVRNSFTPVPLQVLLGATLFGIVFSWASLQSGRKESRARPAR